MLQGTLTSPAGDKHGVGDTEGLEEAEAKETVQQCESMLQSDVQDGHDGHIEVGSEVKDEADGETCNDEATADISNPSHHLDHPSAAPVCANDPNEGQVSHERSKLEGEDQVQMSDTCHRLA